MDYADNIQRIYDHVENDRLEQAVMGCVRLARTMNDYLNTAIFLREMYGDQQQFERIFAEDVQKLKEEVVKFLHDRSSRIWVSDRILPFTLVNGEDDEQMTFPLGAADIESEILQLQHQIQDLIVPAGMTAFDTAAFADSYTMKKSEFRLRIQVAQLIRNRVKARCFNYAVSVEKQLKAQQQPESFLQTIQTEVNNFFSARSEDVYGKLQKAALLVISSDVEDNSLLLTEVRRAIKAVADYFYPPVTDPVICADGKTRKLTDAAYLNRLEEYTVREFLSGSTASELFRAELALLMAFTRKLNDISAKGVHAEVTAEEAKQGFLGLYMFLYNLVSRLQVKDLP